VCAAGKRSGVEVTWYHRHGATCQQEATEQTCRGRGDSASTVRNAYLLPHEMRIGIIRATMGVLLRKADATITGIIMRTYKQVGPACMQHPKVS
jgi:hypothetical protein